MTQSSSHIVMPGKLCLLYIPTCNHAAYNKFTSTPRPVTDIKQSRQAVSNLCAVKEVQLSVSWQETGSRKQTSDPMIVLVLKIKQVTAFGMVLTKKVHEYCSVIGEGCDSSDVLNGCLEAIAFHFSPALVLFGSGGFPATVPCILV
ncbi:hypothetical protein Tco_0848873 [Tanacetum coccineum]